MRQTMAIFVDAYRELNHRRLFWITLMLSGIVVTAFAAMGNDKEGLTIFHWSIPFPFLSSNFIPTADFYKFIFAELGVGFWLGWIATIIALISTASIFPDFVDKGSIDLMLSKPIGRIRLFLTKFLTGLMFAGLQVTVFTLASFLVIGLRGGDWEPWLFIAIPLVLVFYSYPFLHASRGRSAHRIRDRLDHQRFSLLVPDLPGAGG
jgi:ABC-type transport system involved in multi-copper enzyme maturation permease subunit